jgi:hypothetical protein
MHPKKIGLIAHTGKPGVAELIRALGAEFERFKLPVLLEAKTAARLACLLTIDDPGARRIYSSCSGRRNDP